MSPKTAAKWVEAYLKLQKIPGIPSLVLQDAEKKYRVALRKAVPAKPRIRLPRGSKAKRPTLPKLRKELDDVFSKFIRQRDSNDEGWASCVTCGLFAQWRAMDCGHYCPRQDLATRWDERNCHIQDKSCNGFRGGEPEKMAAYIDAKYGAGTASSLRAQARQPFKLNRQWLESKINHYKGLIHD